MRVSTKNITWSNDTLSKWEAAKPQTIIPKINKLKQEETKWIKEWYRVNIKTVNGESKTVNVTDTLVTKIILGTLGCIPAYDRYFIDGMRKSGISYSKLSKSNLKSIAEYYKKHQTEFDRAQQVIYEKSNIHYPAMKLVDMYFWEIGFQAD